MKPARSSLRDPDTAPESRSVWALVNREAFEGQTQELYGKNHVTGRRAYPLPSNPETGSSHPLPFEIERSLADDIAFIAAAKPQVQYVTAIALEQSNSRAPMVIRYAANEGPVQEVEAKLHEVLQVLTRHARKGKVFLDTW